MLFIICELFLFLQGRSDQTLDIYRNQGKQVRPSCLFVEKALINSQVLSAVANLFLFSCLDWGYIL